MNPSPRASIAWLAVPVAYAALRIPFGDWLGAQARYAPELVDLAVAALVLLAGFRNQIRFRFDPTPAAAASCAGFLAAGAGAYAGAGALGLAVPFDLSSAETLLMLLALGPLLEEVLFRQALWLPIERATGSANAALVGTTVLFVAGHAIAWLSVPPEYRPFVAYQSAYVALLGAALGLTMLRTRSLALTCAQHALFNLGFFLYAAAAGLAAPGGGQ